VDDVAAVGSHALLGKPAVAPGEHTATVEDVSAVRSSALLGKPAVAPKRLDKPVVAPDGSVGNGGGDFTAVPPKAQRDADSYRDGQPGFSKLTPHYVAKAILFAPRKLTVPEWGPLMDNLRERTATGVVAGAGEAAFPLLSADACIADRPHPGTNVEPRQPICTVIADAQSPADCGDALWKRVDRVWRHLLGGPETDHS
jgi:hypothetical protein